MEVHVTIGLYWVAIDSNDIGVTQENKLGENKLGVRVKRQFDSLIS